jgi:hypothetical protein
LPADEPRVTEESVAVPSLETEGDLRLWTQGSGDLLAKIRNACKDLTSTDMGGLDGVVAKDGMFWWANRDGTKSVYVPDVPGLREQVVASCHDGAYAGHFGQQKTRRLVQRGFYWPSLYADVCKYVASCDSCQRNKPRSGKPHGLLLPLPVADAPWQHVSMDFIMALPKTQDGHDAVLVVVDRFSKMVKVLCGPVSNNLRRLFEAAPGCKHSLTLV